MYIKNIELQGFKSFLNKTNISLERGVTAVVGPNGCGKTNIIDAVRWVLGEQKKSTLRSAKMEDVIFNGTQSVKPINFCQVKLTIDNDRQILPIEYNEVEISRRLFRTGESEYYINKNLCRLKDIYEMFVDTGMSSDAYSVIELKMIENILSNDKSNFKKMLDEAAGISNYNQQRKSTKNKLKAVMSDMDRVNDIIFEIDKNVKSLNLQMKRFKRHKVLMEDLKNKEILLSGFKINQLIKDEKPIKDKLHSKNTDESSILKEIKDDNDLLKKIELKQNLAQKNILKLKTEIDKNRETLYVSNSKIIKYTENKKFNNSQIEYYKDQISQSDLNDSHLKAKYNELKNDLSKLTPVIKKNSKEFLSFEGDFLKMKKDKDFMLDEINSSNNNLHELFKKMSEIKNDYDILDSNYHTMIKHLSDLEKFKYDKNCKYCIQNGEEQINEKSNLKKSISRLKKDIKSLQNKLKKASKAYKEKKKSIDKLNKNLIEFNFKYNEKDNKYQDLKIKNIELLKEKEGLDFRINAIIDNQTKLNVQVKAHKENIDSLIKHSNQIDSEILNEKKGIDKIKSILDKNLNKSSKLESDYNDASSELKNIQNNMILKQQKKEEKIIDKQNLEIKLNHISNEKKIIENFIIEKYDIDIHKYLDFDNIVDIENLSYEIEKSKKSILNIGPINMAIESEYNKEKERFDFLSNQKKDLLDSEVILNKTIRKLDKEAKVKFLESFELINQNLKKTFSMFFDGGSSYLRLTDDTNPLESDIEIIAKPPGKKNKTLKMLSSGEKALSATAILFAIYLKKPSPFCILDEIDSPLDDSNIKKFTDVIKSFSKTTQFIIITHNKLTMQESDYMYGITQQKQGISDIVSVELGGKA